MQKLKRILALAGALLLIAMYLVTLILGLTSSPGSENMLMASIACTVIVPCLLYGIMLLTRVLDRRDRSDNEKQDKSHTGNTGQGQKHTQPGANSDGNMKGIR